MTYVDGFVTPVPADRKDEYLRFAEAAAAVFRKHGALRLVEAWEDDVPDGKLTDFRRAVQARKGEAVVFSWIVWPSREVRDAAHPKVMSDPRLATREMPFDGARMVFGGFATLFDTAA